jgi:hypothetical protein
MTFLFTFATLIFAFSLTRYACEFTLSGVEGLHEIRSTKVYVRNYNKNMQNKAKFRKVKLNVN